MAKVSRIQKMYPNIYDMALNPAFSQRTKAHLLNNVTAFWNLIGARGQKPSKFECEICGAPMHKRTPRKYMVCQKHLHQYIQEVRWGIRTPKYHIPLVAA